MIGFLQIMFLPYSIMLQARKRENLSKTWKDIREWRALKRDNSERMSAACSLLQLSQDENCSSFCEPHTGTSTPTSMSTCGIEDLECGYHNHNLEDENRRLLRECEWLDNQRLLKENSSLREQYQHLQEECKKLKESESKLSELSLSEESLRDNDVKVKYYTGLPNFAILFNFLAPCVENGNRSVLSRFQQMMVVLMKLHLNLGDQDIAFRFVVNQSTVSRCFSKWMM